MQLDRETRRGSMRSGRWKEVKQRFQPEPCFMAYSTRLKTKTSRGKQAQVPNKPVRQEWRVLSEWRVRGGLTR